MSRRQPARRARPAKGAGRLGPPPAHAPRETGRPQAHVVAYPVIPSPHIPHNPHQHHGGVPGEGGVPGARDHGRAHGVQPHQGGVIKQPIPPWPSRIAVTTLFPPISSAFCSCDVTVWNRTKSKCDPLLSLGAKYVQCIQHRTQLHPIVPYCIQLPSTTTSLRPTTTNAISEIVQILFPDN